MFDGVVTLGRRLFPGPDTGSIVSPMATPGKDARR